MLRSLLFAALALLLAVPAFAQTNTVRFQVNGLFEPVATEGMTALIYSDDPQAEPIERTIGFGGIVTLENLPPGTYWGYLAPNDQAYNWYTQGIVVEAGTSDYFAPVVVRDIDPALGFVRGRVTIAESGNPVRHLNLALPDGWVGSLSNIAVIDGDGRYAFQPPPGSYDLSIPFSYSFPFPPVEGTYRPIDAAFTVAADERITLDLVTQIAQDGLVSGRVTDAETGAPLEDAFIAGYGADGFGFDFVATDADGQYTLTVPEGSQYIVYAQASGVAGEVYVRQYYDGVFSPAGATLVTAEADAPTTGIDFALSSPAADFAVAVQATVVGTDGAPLDGTATIYNRAFADEDVTVPVVNGVLDASVDDTIFAGAPVQVSFSAPGFQSEFFDNSATRSGAQVFRVGPDAVAFDLGEVVLLADGEEEPGLAISGTVAREENGAPLGGAIVTAQRLDAPGIRYAVTDDAGAYRIGGLDHRRVRGPVHRDSPHPGVLPRCGHLDRGGAHRAHVEPQRCRRTDGWSQPTRRCEQRRVAAGDGRPPRRTLRAGQHRLRHRPDRRRRDGDGCRRDGGWTRRHGGLRPDRRPGPVLDERSQRRGRRHRRPRSLRDTKPNGQCR